MATDLQTATHKVVSVNPSTGEVLRELDCADESGVREAVERARSAQPAWFEAGIQHRIKVLKKFQHLLHERKSVIAQLITCEAGKPYVEALATEVLVVLDAARFCIDNAYRLLRDEPVSHGSLAMKQKAGRIVREPHGVIGIISPWNYPFSIPATESLAALVAGNAVIVKPSEFTSQVALALAGLLHDAGVPEAVFQVVFGDGPARRWSTQQLTSLFSPAVFRPARESHNRRACACFQLFWNWVEKIRCWCSKTRTLMSPQAALSGAHL